MRRGAGRSPAKAASVSRRIRRILPLVIAASSVTDQPRRASSARTTGDPSTPSRLTGKYSVPSESPPNPRWLSPAISRTCSMWSATVLASIGGRGLLRSPVNQVSKSALRNCGTNVTMTMPPLAGIRRMIVKGPGGTVAEDDRGGGYVEGCVHGARGDMGEVNEHPKSFEFTNEGATAFG